MRLIPLCLFSVVAYFMIGLLPATCYAIRPNVITTANEVYVFVSTFVYQWDYSEVIDKFS